MTDLETDHAEQAARLATCPHCGGRIDPEATTCGWCQRSSTPDERRRAAMRPPPKVDLARLAQSSGAVPKRWLLLPVLGCHLFALLWLQLWVLPPLADAVDKGRGDRVATSHSRRQISAAEVASYHRAVPLARQRIIGSAVIMLLGFLLVLWRPFVGTLGALGASAAWIAAAWMTWPEAFAVQLRYMALVTGFEIAGFLIVLTRALDRVRLYRQLQRKVEQGDAAPDIVDY